MEPYRLSVLAVTETHLAGEDEIVLDECRGHKMLFSGTGREYRSTVEGVGLVLTPMQDLPSATTNQYPPECYWQNLPHKWDHCLW